jgi:hypothetical protein
LRRDQAVNEEGRREGGSTMREGVDEEIPDTEGQNTVMV